MNKDCYYYYYRNVNHVMYKDDITLFIPKL